MSEFNYDERAARAYDLAVPFDEAEFAFYLELARQAKERSLRTLELACGTGRLTVPLLREGIGVVGVDNSPAMLAAARSKSEGLIAADWREGDMRSFDLGEKFGLIFIAAGTFQLLLQIDEQVACLMRVREHLASGGRFVFNVGNEDPLSMARWLTDRRGTYVRRPQRDYVDPESGHRLQMWGTVEYRTSAQRSVSSGFTEEVDADGLVVAKRYGQPMELRYFGRYEIDHLLARCGLEVQALYGDFKKSAFRGTSPMMLWVARAS